MNLLVIFWRDEDEEENSNNRFLVNGVMQCHSLYTTKDSQRGGTDNGNGSGSKYCDAERENTKVIIQNDQNDNKETAGW